MLRPLFSSTLPRIVSLEPGDTSREAYGMAFDIGTTTVVGYLIDLFPARFEGNRVS